MANKTTVKKTAEKPASPNRTLQKIIDSKNSQEVAFKEHRVIAYSAGPSGAPKKKK